MHEQVQPHPLTPAAFHILLARHDRERYGYDIMQQVKKDSQGAVKMVLDRLIADRLGHQEQQHAGSAPDLPQAWQYRARLTNA